MTHHRSSDIHCEKIVLGNKRSGTANDNILGIWILKLPQRFNSCSMSLFDPSVWRIMSQLNENPD